MGDVPQGPSCTVNLEEYQGKLKELLDGDLETQLAETDQYNEARAPGLFTDVDTATAASLPPLETYEAVGSYDQHGRLRWAWSADRLGPRYFHLDATYVPFPTSQLCPKKDSADQDGEWTESMQIAAFLKGECSCVYFNGEKYTLISNWIDSLIPINGEKAHTETVILKGPANWGKQAILAVHGKWCDDEAKFESHHGLSSSSPLGERNHARIRSATFFIINTKNNKIPMTSVQRFALDGYDLPLRELEWNVDDKLVINQVGRAGPYSESSFGGPYYSDNSFPRADPSTGENISYVSNPENFDAYCNDTNAE